jgi:hypothetical protein
MRLTYISNVGVKTFVQNLMGRTSCWGLITSTGGVSVTTTTPSLPPIRLISETATIFQNSG